MKDSKLILALKTLTPEEVRSFQTYVASPYFNSRPKMPMLLNTIFAFAPNFEEEGLTYEHMYEALYPNERYQVQKIREQLSLLYRLLKSFLSLQEWESNETIKDTLLLTQLRKRHLERSFRAERNALLKRLHSSPLRGAEYHWARYQLASEEASMTAQKAIRVQEEALPLAMQHLDTWYYIQKLRGSTELLNRQNILNTNSKLQGLELIESYFQTGEHPFTSSPAILMYREVLQLIQKGEDETYQQLRNLLEQNSEVFPRFELRALYKHAQNFCIRQINKGNTAYEQELLQLYQQQLVSGVILESGKIAHTDFKNIVTVAIRESDFRWAEEFLTNYKERVSPENRENVFSFCKASLLQAKGEVAQAIRLLQAVEFTDVYYQLSAKHLLLRCYYDQEDWEGLAFLINSFQHFLSRNKGISNQNRTYHQHFLRYFRKLHVLRERQSILSEKEWTERMLKLQTLLKQAKQTAHLGWLQKQVEAAL